MNYARTTDRMYGSYRKGQQYGCAVTRYQSSKERNWQRAQRVLYVVSVVALIAVFVFNK